MICGHISFDTLERTDIIEIHKAFVEAFSDYSVKVDMPIEKFRIFLKSNGFDASLSAGAFVGSTLCGFVLNGIRDIEGVRTAYDSGTGVIPQFRKQGLTKGMFSFLLPLLKADGVKRYVLEVIQDNEPALKLYQGMGFAVTRGLSCLKSKRETFQEEEGNVRIADISSLGENILQSFWEYRPTWQNSFDSINAEPERCAAVIAEQDGEIAGYGVINAQSGRVYQLAVKKGHRGKGLGRQLLCALTQKTDAEHITFLNVDRGCESMLAFLNKQGFEEYVTQYEMALGIR